MLLTATINVHLQGSIPQHGDKSASGRLRIYQAALRAWDERSRLPVVFAENSGANLSALALTVAREDIEFVSISDGATKQYGIG